MSTVTTMVYLKRNLKEIGCLLSEVLGRAIFFPIKFQINQRAECDYSNQIFDEGDDVWRR